MSIAAATSADAPLPSSKLSRLSCITASATPYASRATAAKPLGASFNAATAAASSFDCATALNPTSSAGRCSAAHGGVTTSANAHSG